MPKESQRKEGENCKASSKGIDLRERQREYVYRDKIENSERKGVGKEWRYGRQRGRSRKQ